MGKLALGKVYFQEIRLSSVSYFPPVVRTYILTEAHRLDLFGAAVQKEITLFQFFKIKKKYLRCFSFHNRNHFNCVGLYETAWGPTSMDVRNG